MSMSLAKVSCPTQVSSKMTWHESVDPRHAEPVPPGKLDAPSIFGDAILSLSLLSACVMKFTNVETGDTVDVLLRK